MVAPIQKAIPVRTLQKNIRQIVIEADPEFQTDSNMPVEYKFNNDKRVFVGPYQHRGAYGP